MSIMKCRGRIKSRNVYKGPMDKDNSGEREDLMGEGVQARQGE